MKTFNKNILTFLLFLLFTGTASLTLFAQTPEAFNYQAAVRDANGVVLASQAVTFQISIVATGGSAFYVEQHSATTSDLGLVDFEIGSGTAVSGTFSSIDWGANTYELKVELDPAGGTSFTDMGTSQLISVPYALYAKNVENDLVDDADADPTNELQDISLAGTDLSISNGSTIDLSVLQDGVTDADADPMNEIQTLALSGDGLTLSNGGGMVDLSTFRDTLWAVNDSNIYNLNTGFVGINDTAPASVLSVGERIVLPASEVDTLYKNLHIGGQVNSFNTMGTVGLWIEGYDNDGSLNYPIYVEDENTNVDFYIKNRPNVNGRATGYIGGNLGLAVENPAAALDMAGDSLTIQMTVDQEVDAKLRFVDAQAPSTQNFEIAWNASDQDLHFRSDDNNGEDIFTLFNGGDARLRDKLTIQSFANENLFELLKNGGYGGSMYMNGTNGSRNVWLSGYSAGNNANSGFVGACDTNGTWQSAVYVDVNGDGIVAADIKNFRMEHPSQPGKEIWYASLEGPEAGAYERGTARLVNGRATITFSDHFKEVANPATMTIILTPVSFNSKGLAVGEKLADGFTVGELMNGTGNYEFDWEVKAVRKGYEDYRVIRDASESQPVEFPEEPTEPESNK